MVDKIFNQRSSSAIPDAWESPIEAPERRSITRAQIPDTWESSTDDKPVGVLQDVGRSAASGAIHGATSDVVGMPGTLGQLYDAAVQKVIKYGVLKPAEAMGLFPQGKVDQFISQMGDVANAGESPAVQSGAVNTIFGAPFITASGAERALTKAAPSTHYEPVTGWGRLAESGARMATGMGVFGGAGAAAKVIPEAGASQAALQVARGVGRGLTSGTIGGVTAEGAGQAAESMGAHELAPYVRVLGAIAGGVAGNHLANAARMIAPSVSAEAQLSKALAQDLREGTARMTPAQIQNAIDTGATPTIFDMGGGATDKLLQQYGYLSNQSAAKTRDLTNMILSRAQAAGGNVAGAIDDLFGGKLNPAVQADIITNANKANTNQLYTISRSSPAAQTVWNPQLEQLTGIPLVQKAMRAASQWANDPQANIRPFVPGTATRAPSYPNLNYWDQVKRNLDDQISTSIREGSNDQARLLMGVKSRLVGQLDSIVPEYATARNAAAETFGATNALDAGYNAMKNMNVFKNNEVSKVFAAMPPEQRALFSQGAAGYFREFAESRGPQAFAKLLEQPGIRQRAQMAMGEPTFNAIYGRTLAEKLLSEVHPVAANPTSNQQSAWRQGFIGPAISFAGYSALTAGALSPSHLAALIAGYVAESTSRHVYNFAERQIARRVVDLVTSQDPEAIARLGKLAASSTAARSFLEKTGEGVSRNGRTAYLASQPGQTENNPRPGRASGGSVNATHERLVNRLMTLSNQAKKATNQKTKTLLNVDDSTIARALQVADNAI